VFGDGAQGVAAGAPYDAIVAAAAGDELPPAWIEQLTPGGRVVAPVGGMQQQLIVATRDANGRVQRTVKQAVRFVPLRGGTG
jgi:protein-L-isoaspartate(D-aspartate) O-methyltransferase